VPEEDKDSTYGRYKEMIDNPDCAFKLEQFEKVNVDLPLDKCAEDYEMRIRKTFGLEKSSDIPEFDMLILGMGPDGHTCSLFEGHELLDESTKLIAPIDNSPKPPPKRITMTYPLINNAKVVLIGAAGAGKADVLKRILVDKDQKYPVTRICPKEGRLIFVVDDDAGKFIDEDPSTDA
jgi:6-phosphogluconolactonase